MDTKSVLETFAAWCSRQCDGDWEHTAAVQIQMLDNPGWYLQVDLSETDLATLSYSGFDIRNGGDDWINCWLQEERFHAVGDVSKLEALLSEFLKVVSVLPGNLTDAHNTARV